MKILVCGGDARQLYAAKKLRGDGYDISFALTDGGNDEETAFAGKIEDADAVLLPLPAFRAGLFNAPASSLRLGIAELAALLRNAKIVIGGILPPALTDAPDVRGVGFFDYYPDPAFTLPNALLTAEGVLGILISQTPRAVRNAEYLIAGYGCCGRATARSLAAAGARVTVAARREDARESAEADGCFSSSFEDLPSIASRFDAVVNTVPAPVIGADVICRLKKDALLLEIASAPFGVDFEAAAKENIRVIKAPGIPGRFAADSAGQIIASCAEKYLRQCRAAELCGLAANKKGEEAL